MTKQQAVDQFKEIYPNYKEEAKKDYCKMQLAWACFIDGLCKDRVISQSQYDRWTTPF